MLLERLSRLSRFLCSTSTNKPLQLTLTIIKPDATANPYVVTSIRDIIINNGFYVVHTKHLKLSLEDAQRFYDVHSGKFFYNRLITFMSSGPIYVHILAHPDAIAKWRLIMGPTKSYRAQYEAPESIRGQFGLSDTRNAVHGSDSNETSSKEIKFFFPNFDVHKWYETEEQHFRSNKVHLDRETFEHQVRQQKQGHFL